MLSALLFETRIRGCKRPRAIIDCDIFFLGGRRKDFRSFFRLGFRCSRMNLFVCRKMHVERYINVFEDYLKSETELFLCNHYLLFGLNI